MQRTLAAIEQALGIVQKTLDALTSRGDDEAAYEVARAQYRASIRDSWPGNLGGLLRTLEDVQRDPKLRLTSEEREHVAHAVRLLREALGQ